MHSHEASTGLVSHAWPLYTILMPRDYEAAVDDLLAAIHTYLQHHQDEPVTDDAIAAYLSGTDLREIYQDLMQYPACREPARHLSGDASTSPLVILTMLWGRVHNQPPAKTIAGRP
jgi:hypothetical protein